MAVPDGLQLHRRQGEGPRSATCFDDRTLAPLDGHLAIGHTRYSTTGPQHVAQRPAGVARPPPGASSPWPTTATSPTPASWPTSAPMPPGTVTSDSDLVRRADRRRAGGHGRGAPSASTTSSGPSSRVLPRLEGAFSHDHRRRDPRHRRARPQRLPAPVPGQARARGWVLASESPALDIAGATFVRELDPGEVVVVDREGLPVASGRGAPGPSTPALCIFEFFYFARPDTPALRPERPRRPGSGWASCWPSRRPAEADMVMGVPESGIPRRRGLRPGLRHPLRPGPGEEPLHRPHLHRPDARSCAARPSS